MQENNKKRLKKNYNNQWTDYLMVTESGDLISPDYVTDAFRRLVKKNKMRHIRFHDLRHPYVKLKLKILSAYFSRTFGAKVLDFPLDFKSVIGIYTHLFDKHICKCLC